MEPTPTPSPAPEPTPDPEMISGVVSLSTQQYDAILNAIHLNVAGTFILIGVLVAVIVAIGLFTWQNTR